MSDAYLLGGVRTPIGRYGGVLAPVRPDDLAAHVIRELLVRFPGLDPERIDDVLLGCANQAGEDNRNVARMAALIAGLPESVPGATVNRLCASGMEAVLIAARQIKLGEAEVVIAGGVESMSRAPFVLPKSEQPFGRKAEIFDTTIGWRFINPVLASAVGTDSIPGTGENGAEDFQVSRVDRDAFALCSQQRAARAVQNGCSAAEIAPVSVPQRRAEPRLVDRDEHPRETSLERLSALPTPFRSGGTVTAGNSSGVNDGAAALLIVSESVVEQLGVRPLAKIIGGAAAGVAPRVMGIGPVPATQKLLGRLGLSLGQIDVIELNEAFAAQSLAVLRELGLPDDAEHVNPNGGAIALGHPLGMSGARLLLTAAFELRERAAGRALCTMCVGVGQGVAATLEAT
ncbi:MAG: 3-oxoadipyl-CoA thiolase [Solirubrobacteraceae bacterium]